MTKLAYTIEEATKEGIGGKTKIYEAIKSGALKAKKRGNSTILLHPDLIQYLKDLPDFPGQAAA